MNTALVRIVAFVIGLAVIFAAGLAVGRAAGPDVEPVAEHDRGGSHGNAVGKGHGKGDGHEKHPGDDARPARHGGVSLDLDRERLSPGPDRRVSFRLLDDGGAPLASYDEKHERDLHLILVGIPTLTDYQHLHPTLDGDRWTARAALAPSRYRVYADGRTEGDEFLAEGVLRVRGQQAGGGSFPAPSTLARVGPYAVELDVGAGSAVTLSVSRNGKPVIDLEPHLGASGHLVVIRGGSLDYLHAHPEEGPPGPEVSFTVEFDRPGRHRLFFDFRHDGVVRTAAFTLRVRGGHGGGGHEH